MKRIISKKLPIHLHIKLQLLPPQQISKPMNEVKNIKTKDIDYKFILTSSLLMISEILPFTQFKENGIAEKIIKILKE